MSVDTSPVSRGFVGRGRETAHAERVPPGQYVTRDFPVLSAGPTPHTSLERFVWQYTAVWLAFLIVGGLAVVTQIFVYFFWPVYVLAFWAIVRADRSFAYRQLAPRAASDVS